MSKTKTKQGIITKIPKYVKGIEYGLEEVAKL
jgi:hypothetical protein